MILNRDNLKFRVALSQYKKEKIMANEVTVEGRYMKYNKAEVEELLDKVHDADAEPTAESENMISSGAVREALGNYATKEDLKVASEEAVRGIVKNWSPDQEPELEPEPEEESGE